MGLCLSLGGLCCHFLCSTRQAPYGLSFFSLELIPFASRWRSVVYLLWGWAPCPFKQMLPFGARLTRPPMDFPKAKQSKCDQHSTLKRIIDRKKENNSELMLMFYILFLRPNSPCPFFCRRGDLSTKVTYWFAVRLLELVMIWEYQGHPSSDGIESHRCRVATVAFSNAINTLMVW